MCEVCLLHPSELVARTGLLVLKIESTPTFRNPDSSGNISVVTFSYESLVSSVKGLEVLENIPESFYQYMAFKPDDAIF